MGILSLVLYIFLCGGVVWATLAEKTVDPFGLLIIACIFYSLGWATERSRTDKE